MQVKINSLNKQLEKEDLEKFTRKLYIHRQKDRPKRRRRKRDEKPGDQDNQRGL